MNSTSTFWVNCIMCSPGGEPWHCACQDPELSLNDALAVVMKYEKDYADSLILAWIQGFDQDGKFEKIYWLRNYVNAIGTRELMIKKKREESKDGSVKEHQQGNEGSRQERGRYFWREYDDLAIDEDH